MDARHGTPRIVTSVSDKITRLVDLMCAFWATLTNHFDLKARPWVDGPQAEGRAYLGARRGLVMGAHAFISRNSPATILGCDHCRGELGLDVQRYWHMQFCSSACIAAYQQRLAP